MMLPALIFPCGISTLCVCQLMSVSFVVISTCLSVGLYRWIRVFHRRQLTSASFERVHRYLVFAMFTAVFTAVAIFILWFIVALLVGKGAVLVPASAIAGGIIAVYFATTATIKSMNEYELRIVRGSVLKDVPLRIKDDAELQADAEEVS